MHFAFSILCTGVYECNKCFVSRKDARSTNVGRVLEAHGHHLLGSYKDPIASFHDFYQLSIEKPEVRKINRPLNLITYIIGFVDNVYLQIHAANNPEPCKLQVYWKIVLKELNLKFHNQPSCILNADETEIQGEPSPGGRWLPGAVLNAAECCLQADSKERANKVAILWRDEGQDNSAISSLTVAELHAWVW